MHLAIALIGLTIATGSLIFVIVMGRKTKKLYAEAEANWKKAGENWRKAEAHWGRAATAWGHVADPEAKPNND